MPLRLLPLLALATCLGLTAVPAPVAQGQTSATTPGVIIRIRPIDTIQADVKYLLKAVGQEEAGAQVDELLKLYTENSGVDTKRPLGGYALLGAKSTDTVGVIMLPISNEKAFLKKLDGLNYVVKEAGGVHTVKELAGGQDGHMRFANGYAYVASDASAVKEAGKLLAASAVFDPKDTAAVSVILRMNGIPAGVRDEFLKELAKNTDAANGQKLPDESEALTKFRIALLANMQDQFKAYLTDGNELALRFDIDQKAGEVSIDTSFNAKPGTKLAANLKSWEAKSLFGGALGSDSALNLLVNVAMADDLKKALGPVIDEGMVKAIQAQSKDSDKAISEKFLKVLAPTLKAGELDMALTLRGPNKNNKYTVVSGIKVKDGKAIETALRDIVKNLKDEEQKRITLDADKIGTVNVHKLDILKDVTEKGKSVFGDGPLFFALRPDAAYFAGGDDAMAALKDAVNAKPATAPAVQFEMSINRFATILANEDPGIAKAAEAAFKAKGSDKVRVVMEGGNAMRLRFSVKTEVIRFLVEAAKMKGVIPGGAANQ